ncbi:MAG: sodium:solute symporter [Spirochaetes bacterium GWD1_61_31]|nr:MAG: sodium:solute symporter [Spirochaetes bacterium GWB1_60_80]OHD34679.1 MAG: sodium:solute symporter [Spirochaetes bacterium GWC1_61_12]OHD34965.1 MAG: sodium:solute symporter [Spirochaetes bacterium GWD1_61_31]OHD42423.1 MAG: sodium:solute symporter [Spirochaetes bacterium GWE1_60_18]OHD59226.1 MAG: sodium:solute symporter [Spirochaetes bacterium GWF1_60_12]HAP43073.1 sodium:solute symporter [Spirochaetaceae bacterium]
MAAKLVVLGAYFAMIVIVGIIQGRKTKSFSDFFLGSGTVGPWMTAFTYGAAYFSAVLFIGYAGNLGWNFGLSSLWIAVFNALFGVLGVWLLLGYRVKKVSTEMKISTMPEYFEKRYKSPFMKLFSTAAIFIFFIPYSAAVFIGLSYLFQLNLGIPYWVALMAMGIFTAIYITLGGYKSMTMLDVIFGIFMLIGGAFIIGSVVVKGGGVAKLVADLAAIDPKLVAPVGPPGIWPLFCLVFLTSVAPFAMPQLIQKFYAIKDKKSVKIGMWVSSAFAIILSTVAYFSGSVIRLFVNAQNSPEAFTAAGKPIYDALMPFMMQLMVPGFFSVFILLLILSASMSTLAALVLISSSAIAKDFYQGFIKKDASDKHITGLMRVLSVIFVLLSVILAYFKPATIVSILGISWGAIGSVFLGPFIWGILFKKTNVVGAMASSVLGLTVCLVLYFAKLPSPQAGTIGMLVSLAVAPLVSLIVPVKQSAA